MNTALASPFLAPFLLGLCHAALLGLLGCYLRLRGEWLAALAFAQMSAAGALLALAFLMPPLAGGAAGAAIALALKQSLSEGARGTSLQALLMLLGGSVALLVSANTPASEPLAHALFDGQLLFAARRDCFVMLAALPLCLLALRMLSRRLLLWQSFADFARARGMAQRSNALAFDALCALALTLAVSQLGVSSAFALTFAPPYLAFKFAPHWRAALALSATLALLSHCAAFALALMLDQPYGAVLTLLLCALALLGSGFRWENSNKPPSLRA